LADKVVAFYSLAVGSVEPGVTPTRVLRGLVRHPVPVMILARLAVDKNHQCKGLGKALLKDALCRTAQAADIAGIRCLLVHAKDDTARQWYAAWEFEPSPTDLGRVYKLRRCAAQSGRSNSAPTVTRPPRHCWGRSPPGHPPRFLR